MYFSYREIIYVQRTNDKHEKGNKIPLFLFHLSSHFALFATFAFSTLFEFLLALSVHSKGHVKK